jgi:hypothetical protein
VRFRLFDRVRRSREPERAHGEAVERGRGSGRHRQGNAADRQRHPADQSGSAIDRRSNGAERLGGITWQARPAEQSQREWPGQSDRARRTPQVDAGQRWAPAGGDGWARAQPDAHGGPADRFPPPGGDGGPAGRDDWAGAGRDAVRRWPPEPDPRAARPSPWNAAPGGLPPWDAAANPPVPWDPAARRPPRDRLPWDAPARDQVPADPVPRNPVPRNPVPRDGVPRDRLPWDAPRDRAPWEGAARDDPPGEAAPGAGRARVRESPAGSEPFTSPVRDKPSTGTPGRTEARRGPAGRGGRDAAARRPWYEVRNPAGAQLTRQASDARAVAAQGHADGRAAPGARPDGRPAAGLPYTAPRQPDERYQPDGRQHCGVLESVLHRQWDAAAPPPAEIVRAIERLAELPAKLKEKLAAGLEGIFVGPGGVPELDDMQHLRGVPLPAGRATWDVCAGAYGGRKIVVGAQPSPTPDVMCHEIGHALDDIDTPGQWLSDRPEFRLLYDQCLPHLVSDFHRQQGGLGRREFFADAFAAIASRQRPALVDMLGGDTRAALNVMLFFNRRYGI